MAESDRIEMPDAARPQCGRDDLFADVEVLRGLVRAAADAAPGDQQRLSFGSNEQQGISLADVDGFNEERVVRMIDWPGKYDGNRSVKQCKTCGGTEPIGPVLIAGPSEEARGAEEN